MSHLTRVARFPAARAVLPWAGLILLAAGLVPVLAAPYGSVFLGAIVGTIGLVVILVRPYVGVLLIWILWFVKGAIVTYALSALLLVPLALQLVRDRRIWIWQLPQVRLLCGIAVLFLVSAWWNEFVFPVQMLVELDETALQLRIFVSRLLVVVLWLYFVVTRRQIELLIWVTLGFIVMAALSGLPAFVSGGGFRRLHATFSLAQNANRLAFICLFATSLLWFYHSHGSSQRLRAVTRPLLLILPMVTLATASRSGLLNSMLLGALIIREQRGWSPAKRLRTVVFLGLLGLLTVGLVPTAQLMRATTFDPRQVAQGQDSLRNRLNTVIAAAKMVANNPVFGVGLGNFVGVKRAEYGLPRREHTHNAYLWAATSGGLLALGLYLLLFRVTYRTLRELEATGPPEFLWMARGLRVNLVLFLVFSTFADMWLTEFFFLLVGLPPVMWAVARHHVRARQPPPLPAVARRVGPLLSTGVPAR